MTQHTAPPGTSVEHRDRPGCQVEFAIWARSLDIDWHEKALLLLLVSYVDTDSTGICWPSQVELSRVMGGVTARHIRRLLNELEAGNYIYVEHSRSDRGRAKTNVYHLDPGTDPSLELVCDGIYRHRKPASPGDHRTLASAGIEPSPPDTGVLSSTGHGGPGTDTTTDRNRETPTPSPNRSTGRRTDGRIDHSSSRQRQRPRSDRSTTKQTPTSATAAGPRSPRARARSGKQVAHVDVNGNVSHRLNDDEVQRRFAHTGPESLPFELEQHGFRFDGDTLVAWPAWYDREARLSLHIGSTALRPENGYRQREAQREVERATAT